MKQSEKSALARQRILDAAISEFASCGYHGTSLNLICERHEISKGLIYHHFTDKDTLYLLCVQTCFDKLMPWITEAAKGLHGTLEEQLAQYFDARLEFFARESLCMGMFADVMFRPPMELAQEISQIRKPFDELNLSLLKGLLSGQKLRSGLSVDAIVEDFHMYMDFFHIQLQSSRNEAVTPRQAVIDHDKKARRQIGILLHGILE